MMISYYYFFSQTLDADREGLIKMKKALKSIHQSGSVNVESELALSRALERLGNGALSQEPELGAAFLKFSVVTKELSNLKKTLVRKKKPKRLNFFF